MNEIGVVELFSSGTTEAGVIRVVVMSLLVKECGITVRHRAGAKMRKVQVGFYKHCRSCNLKEGYGNLPERVEAVTGTWKGLAERERCSTRSQYTISPR
jgi:hypothetical protein